VCGHRIVTGACSRRQGGSGRASARQKAVSLNARWPARAAHGTRGPRQLDGSGCARGMYMSLRGLWREDRAGGGRFAWGEECTPGDRCPV
jgi:hypothetical protein